MPMALIVFPVNDHPMEPEDIPAFIRLPDGSIAIVRPEGRVDRIDPHGELLTEDVSDPGALPALH